MPQGKGTYGSKVGRPSKKDKQKRKPYLTGGGSDSSPRTEVIRGSGSSPIIRGIEGKATSILNPYYTPANQALRVAEQVQIGDQVIDPRVISLLDKTNNTVNNVVKGVVEAVVPGGKRPLRDWIKRRRAAAAERKREEEEEQQPEREESYSGGKMRKVYQEGGEPSMEDQMEGLAISVQPITVEEETHTMPDGTIMPGATHEEYEEQMLPDEEMEEDYVDYVVNSTLSVEDKNYLESALAEDAKLSELFDQVVESASEFSGSGPIEGPGTEVSDSIPARLSDGEFVFTAKATDEIGEDSLMSMMKDAEAAADERQTVAYGGVIDEEDQAVPIQTRGSVAAQGNVPNVVKQSRQVEEEMLKSSPRRYYVPVSG